MSLRIIADSGSDVDSGLILRYDLTVIPLRTYFGDEEFLDGVTMTHQEFFERLTTDSHHPTTSQPSPEDFLRAFRAAKEAGDDVLAIIISGKLSGTLQSAKLAADECGYDRIFIVDSENVTLGTRILVELACRLRDEGKTAEEIAALLNENKKHIRMLAALDTLTYLQKGGRISKTVAAAGNLLSIKPVVAVENGEIKLVGKARGAKSSERLLAKLLEENGGVNFDMPFCLAYSGLSRSHLEEYIDAYQDLWRGQIDELPICTIGSTIGTHAGPGAIGISFFAKRKG